MDILKALEHHCKNLNCTYTVGEDYDSLNWLCTEHTKPTLIQLELAWDEYLINRQRNAYKEKRAAEYPSIVDQLDMIFHGGLDAWKAKIQEVKDKYPKPE